MKTFKLRIEVDVTTIGDRPIDDAIADAMQELVNRRDFRHGTIQPGRVIHHTADFDAMVLTVDLMRSSHVTRP